MQTTSISLLSRIRELNNPEAWARFVRLYSPMLYGWARQMHLSHEDSLDLVQDIFTVLVKNLPNFDYDSHKRFRGWLWIVTRRRWLEWKRRTTLTFNPNCSLEDIPANATDDQMTEEEAEFRKYLIRSLIPSLSCHFAESTWRAFWKHVIDGRPAVEVAAEEGLSVAAVYKAKLRVTARIQDEFSDLLSK